MSASSGRKPVKWVLAAIGIGSVAVAVYLISSRDRTVALGAEQADIISKLENGRRMADAERVRQACAGDKAPSCECRQEAAHRALDRDLHAEARAVLEADEKCAAEPASKARLAEALARGAKHDEALARAADVLPAQPNDAFAHYAIAHAHWAKGDVAKAGQYAQKAAELGRGSPANLLLGLIAYRNRDLGTAKAEFEKMLTQNAEDIDALFNLAVIAAQQNRYRDAREGYLKVLQLDARHVDARYNLGLLTHSAGATAEAKHHLAKLEAIAPQGDARVTNLKKALEAPPPQPPQGVVSGQVPDR